MLYLQSRVAYVRDENAYKEIYYHFYPALFRFAYHFTQNDHDADIIVSDSMIKIWTIGNRIAYIDDLKLYLFKIAKMNSLKFLAQRKKNVEFGENLNDKIADERNPAAELQYNEVKRKIEEAIGLLPKQSQLVFRLAKQEGMSYREIGAILEISQNTIETHMRNALKKIRLQLDAYLSGKNMQ